MHQRGTAHRVMVACRSAAVAIALSVGCVSLAGGEQPPEPALVEAAIAEAQAELRALEEQGADLGADDGPVRARVLALWDLGRSAPTSEAGARATTEALRLLVRIGRAAEAAAKSEDLGAAEHGAWEGLLNDLVAEARASRDYEPLVEAAQARLRGLGEGDREERARLWFTLGRVHVEEARTRDALHAFRRVIESAPGSSLAEAAESMLFRLEELAPGRPAPSFSATTLDGQPLSLSRLSGGAVLVAVWASW